MSEANQGNNPDASAIVPAKRKRGRPRKYPKLDVDWGGDAHVSRNQNLDSGENAHPPPGFGRVNANQPNEVGPVNDENDPMIGQAVYGVVEAAFDAGFLLNVRVGSSETTLRGVVFKPGHYVPVTADNDVAPGVEMIRRNEIPLPRESNTQVSSRNRWSRNRHGTARASRAVNPVASKGKQVHSVIPQTSPAIPRGNVVPVVLQPVNQSNGLTATSGRSATYQAANPVPSIDTQALAPVHPSNGSTLTSQVYHLQPQNNQLVMPSGRQNESGCFNPNSAEQPCEAEAKPIKTSGLPFETLLTEVIKRVPSQTVETDSSSPVKLSAKDSGVVAEDDATDTDQPLSVEPLQILQPNVGSQPETASRPSETHRTGKMTELLQVLQENMTENEAKWAE